MANELEASELAVANEDYENEGISHVSSLVEGAAENSTKAVKDAKLEEKTVAEMHLDNKTQMSVLTGIEDDEAEETRDLNEPSKITTRTSEAVEKPDLNTVNEEVMGTGVEPKTELGPASLANSESKPVDKVILEPEAVSGDKPVGSDESKYADELVPDPESGDIPEEGDKPLTGPEKGEVPLEDDNTLLGPEKSEVREEGDKPLPGPEKSEIREEGDKPLPGPEKVEVPEGDKPLSGPKQVEVPDEGDKPLPGPEKSEIQEEGDKPLPGPEKVEVPEGDKPLPAEVPEEGNNTLPGPEAAEVPEEGNNTLPGPEAAEVPEEGDKPLPGPEKVEVPEGDKPLPAEVPEEGNNTLPGPEAAEVPEEGDKPLPGPEQVEVPEGDKPLPGPEKGEVPIEDDNTLLGPEQVEVPEEGDKPLPAEVPEEGNKTLAGPEKSEVPEEGDKPLPGPEQVEVPDEGDKPLPGLEQVEVADENKPLAGLKQGPGDEPEQNGELSPGLAPEGDDEEIPAPEKVQTDRHELEGDELEAEDEQIPGPDAEADSEDEEKEILQDEDNTEEKIEKPLDDDQDRRNPQYIPKGGAFYEHDNRTSLEDVENKDPQENEKKKKSWKESKDSEEWLHDCYNESEQQPKSTAEIIETYGYDIRRDDAPPRARRRRKYGRGPDKYERSWEDEQAYQMKQSNIGRRGRKKLFGKDEFPPLPNQKFDSSVSKPVQKSSIRKKEEIGSKSVNVKLNGNDKLPTTSQATRSSHSGNQNNLHGVNSNRKTYSNTNKKLNDSDIKPFRNDDGKWKTPLKHGRQDDLPKPIRTQPVRHTDPPFRRSVEANKNSVKEPHISQMTDGISQMTFVNKQADMRDMRLKTNGSEESKINEPEVENPVSRQNPKRYSKIRKGFTGIFPPEEVSELNQTELHKLQQEQQKNQHLTITQPLNMQNVMKRYAGTYGSLGNCVSDFVPGTSSYLQARPIISGIPPQALSPQGIHQQALSPQGIHQQALSPQAIPQQALSPQVSGLPTIELQQNPLAQPNFVPQPMYVDPHYTSDVMGPFTGYPPYAGSQAGDVYQPSRGITYYNTECQTSGQKRPPPRRQNAAIPILPPEK